MKRRPTRRFSQAGEVFSRLTRLFFLLLIAGWATAQGPAEGYVEGKIVELDALARVALVELQGGQVVVAELGEAWSEGVDAQLTRDFAVGERVELFFLATPNGERQYLVSDWVRYPSLLTLAGLFLLVSVAIAKGKGFRAFVATATSLAITVLVVVPGIIAGWDPVTLSLVGVGGMLVLAIYFVHGITWSTTAALLGTLGAILFTIVLALFFTENARLTGLASHEALYINLGAATVSLKGILLAGLLIGALGALTDITIVQASVVRELAHVNPEFGLQELYTRAMRVGLDHIGSLVNTLVLAYTGAALPLLVILQLDGFSLLRALNLEIVAAEVVHTLVGSIGLVVAVPVTTLIAAFLFRGDRLPVAPGELDHAHHHH